MNIGFSNRYNGFKRIGGSFQQASGPLIWIWEGAVPLLFSRI
jgi:hypothetical protein